MYKRQSLEAQVSSISDDIAYNTHDVDDGLRAGLFDVEELMGQPMVGSILKEVIQLYPQINEGRLIHETTRRMIDLMTDDLLRESRFRLKKFNPESADDVRSLCSPIISLSEEMKQNNLTLKNFLFEKMYRHPRVNRMTNRASRVIKELFDLFMKEPNLLPLDWQAKICGLNETMRARIVTDYIAGMTDRFALGEHKRQFGLYE